MVRKVRSSLLLPAFFNCLRSRDLLTIYLDKAAYSYLKIFELWASDQIHQERFGLGPDPTEGVTLFDRPPCGRPTL